MSDNNNTNSREGKRIAEGAEDIEIIIRQVKRDTSVFLLIVLQSLINEQIEARQLKRDVGNYIYQAVKDQAIRKGGLNKGTER